MKKNLIFAITMMLFCGTGALKAQQVEDYEITVITDDGEQDVIDVPEGMMVELDSLLSLFNSKTYLQDESCNYRDENTEYPADVYIDRLQRMPTVMEMSYNEVVQKFIDRYATRLRRSVSYMLGASNFYMPIFEEALERYNVPLELKYLPVIESALNPRAVSPVGAGGLWQFMVTTAKQYNLEVNSLVDERCDPIKSSDAAARFLRDLYKVFGDWNLVIASYNCGPGNVTKAIHRAGGVKDYWAVYKYLPRETQGYVPAFIAANYIMNYYCEHGICPMRTILPTQSDTIMLDRDVHFGQIAAVTGISIDELRTLNPQYRRDMVNGSSKPSVLRMPQKYINAFIDNEDSIYSHEVDRFLTKRAVVNVTANDQAAASTRQSYVRSSRHSYAQSNNRQAYSSRKSRAERKSKNSASVSRKRGRKQASQEVTIKQGQTLSEIARKHGTTVDKIKKLNGIKGSTIRAGKKLKVK